MNKPIEKNKKVLFIIAAACIILFVVVFLISGLFGPKENPGVKATPTPEIKKSSFESLSTPAIDPSGKPIVENNLQNLSQPVPEASASKSPVDNLKNLSEPVR